APRPLLVPPSPSTTLFRSDLVGEAVVEVVPHLLDELVVGEVLQDQVVGVVVLLGHRAPVRSVAPKCMNRTGGAPANIPRGGTSRSEEHTSELQSRENLVCR